GIGKASFTEEQLLANFTALLEAVVGAKPAASKAQYLRSIAISTTMGPGIHIDPVKADGVPQAAPAYQRVRSMPTAERTLKHGDQEFCVLPSAICVLLVKRASGVLQ